MDKHPHDLTHQYYQYLKLVRAMPELPEAHEIFYHFSSQTPSKEDLVNLFLDTRPIHQAVAEIKRNQDREGYVGPRTRIPPDPVKSVQRVALSILQREYNLANIMIIAQNWADFAQKNGNETLH